ncbi:hypothetical protein WMF11_30210 [Sorangium sp. So ce295]|uniref:hypothetical protein n=1 Tax=Sorangium sp. So ce295 TaxID=3133295 RepID=UPI003F640500
MALGLLLGSAAVVVAHAQAPKAQKAQKKPKAQKATSQPKAQSVGTSPPSGAPLALLRSKLPPGSGVYFVYSVKAQSNGFDKAFRYVGSSWNLRNRLTDPKHPINDVSSHAPGVPLLENAKDLVVLIWELRFADFPSNSACMCVRYWEQRAMAATSTWPGNDGVLNERLPVSEEEAANMAAVCKDIKPSRVRVILGDKLEILETTEEYNAFLARQRQNNPETEAERAQRELRKPDRPGPNDLPSSRNLWGRHWDLRPSQDVPAQLPAGGQNAIRRGIDYGRERYTLRRDLPRTLGIYHLTGTLPNVGQQYYTGSASNVFDRLLRQTHAKADHILNHHDASVMVWPVNLPSASDPEKMCSCLLWAEQKIMGLMANTPNSRASIAPSWLDANKGSLNSYRALSEAAVNELEPICRTTLAGTTQQVEGRPVLTPAMGKTVWPVPSGVYPACVPQDEGRCELDVECCENGVDDAPYTGAFSWRARCVKDKNTNIGTCRKPTCVKAGDACNWTAESSQQHWLGKSCCLDGATQGGARQGQTSYHCYPTNNRTKDGTCVQ